MTTVKFKDKHVDLVLNWYALRLFGGRVDAKSPSQSFDKLREVMGSFKNDIPFNTMDVIANLFFAMHETACLSKKKEPLFTIVEAFDVITEAEAFEGIVKEVNEFLSVPETVKKKEQKVAAKLT